jgi:hypothetical protein
MHFFISLIIFCSFAFVAGLGLAQVIWDLSEIRAQASLDMPKEPMARGVHDYLRESK